VKSFGKCLKIILEAFPALKKSSEVRLTIESLTVES
jgi:hypothetical protein